MWLTDFNTANWIEGGYSTYSRRGAGTSEDYFYGYTYGGQSQLEVDIGTVPSGDYGNSTLVQFSLESGTMFQMVFSSNNFYDQFNLTANGVSGSIISIGQELEGTSGASASTAYFTYNKWRDTKQGLFHFQGGTNGTSTISGPPYGDWTVPPSQSSTGGSWWTQCC